MNQKMRVLALIMAVVMVLALTSCGNSAQPAGEPAESGGTAESSGTSCLTVGSTNEEWIVGLDPNGANAVSLSYGYAFLCYDQIVFWDPVKDELSSDILADWYYADGDDQTLYLVLKDNVYFANGEQMTGEDILFSLGILAGTFNFGEYYEAIDLENSYVEDDGLTVVLKYSRPFAPGIKGFINCWVEDKSWIEEHGGMDAIDFYDTSLVNGSGPYEIVDFVKDTSMTLRYRADWWMAEERSNSFCSADEIKLVQYSDATTMMIDYENGVLDIAMFGLTDSDIKRFDEGKSHGAYKIVNTNSNALIVLDPDCEEFSDLRVRQAVCMAIDTDAISDAVFGSMASHADSVFSSGTTGYVGNNAYPYDPDQARALLEEAGVTGLQLTMVCVSADDEVQIGEMTQAYLADVGIDMELKILDMDSAVAMWMDPATSGQLQQFKSAGGNILRDPLYVTSAYLPTSIFSILSRDSGEIADLISAGLVTMDENERTEIYQQLQVAFYENAEIIPLCEWNSAYCYNTDTIADMHLDSTYSPNLRWIELAN